MSHLRKRELAEGRCSLEGPQRRPPRPLQARSDLRGRPLPAVRAPGEGAFCLQRLAALAAGSRALPIRPARPSPSSRRRLRTRYWNVACPRRASNMRYTCHSVKIAASQARGRPVVEFRQPPEALRHPGALLDGALQAAPPPPARRTRRPWSARQRPERVPVERLGRHPAAVRVHVLRGRHTAQALPSSRSSPRSSSRVAKRQGTSPRGASPCSSCRSARSLSAGARSWPGRRRLLHRRRAPSRFAESRSCSRISSSSSGAGSRPGTPPARRDRCW